MFASRDVINVSHIIMPHYERISRNGTRVNNVPSHAWFVRGFLRTYQGKERHAMEKSRRLSAEQAKKSRRRSSLAQAR